MTTLDDVRVEALFCSSLQRSDQPSLDQIRDAVTAQMVDPGVAGCAAQVAYECGEHPDVAVPRIRWCRTAVRHAYSTALV